jgi:hypothetical protein
MTVTGSIPALTGLTNLTDFYVGNNHLTGAVPAAPPALVSDGSSRRPNPLNTALT